MWSIVGSLELASLQSNQKYFMDSANVKLARSAKLANEYIAMASSSRPARIIPGFGMF